jgi:hypothetical protein
MNLYSTTRETFRRLIDRHQASRTIEKRTYVFVFVPFDFRTSSHAKRIDMVNDRANEQRLDDELMWTWFLPNPLSPTKEQK